MKIFLNLLLMLLLSSCGFNALYKQEATSGPLDTIEVSPIASMDGAELYHYLSDLLPLRKEPVYILKVSFTNSESPIAIQKNSDIIRENISQVVQFQLQDIRTGKIVTSGKFRQMTSYNSAFFPYASYVEKENTVKNLTKYSGEEIRRRLILYFKSLGK